MRGIGAAITLGIAAAVLILFSLAWATGAPSAPTASISGSITPNAAQTLQVTFQTQVESTAPPNSIWQLPSNFVYTATETSASQGTTVIAQQQHVAASVSPSSHWPVFILTATVSLNTVAVCTSSCAGVVSNLTITVTAQTWGGGLSSPMSTIVFSSSPGFQVVPPMGPLNTLTYDGQAMAAVAGFGLALLAVAAIRPHPYYVSSGLVLTAIGFLGLVLLQ